MYIYIYIFFLCCKMNSIWRRRTVLMTAQSYDCIVALYLHNIFLFTSLLVEFYCSIWKSCIWCGEIFFFFYSIYFVLFCLYAWRSNDDWYCSHTHTLHVHEMKMESDTMYWKCACIDFQVILYNEWQQKSDYSA